MTKIALDAETRVTDVMTWPVLTLDEDATLKDAARFFMDHKFTGAPVVDRNGKPVGVLTLKDLVRYTEWHLEVEESEAEEPSKLPASEIEDEEIGPELPEDRMSRVAVKQVMTPKLKTVAESATLRKVMDVFLKARIHRIFVTDKAGRLTGVVSTLDVIRWLKDRAK